MTKHHLKGLGLKLNDYRPSAAQATAMTERFLCIEQKIATYSRVKDLWMTVLPSGCVETLNPKS
jgi:hypothetical protein